QFDQPFAVHEFDWHTTGKLFRRSGKKPGRNENGSRCANLMHCANKFANPWNANLIRKPVLALDEKRRLIPEEDQIVAAIRMCPTGVLDVESLAPVCLSHKLLEVRPVQPPDALEHRDL